ncbi:MAG: hypothetical protein IKL65_04780 [Bacilli bacterium]|nr:hypothetical protein [Bacilli bacterium]
MNLKEKWEKDYIDNLDLNEIEWVNLNKQQLLDFYEENYLDKKEWQYVSNMDTWGIPLGLRYLSFRPENKNYNYLLGLVKNNVDKKTIVAAMIYVPNYFVFTNQDIPVTFICTIETNLYFRNKGLSKQLCDQILNFINPSQHIIVTRETDMGKKYNVLNILKETLFKNGFDKTIWENDIWNYNNREFCEAIIGKQKILKNKKV